MQPRSNATHRQVLAAALLSLVAGTASAGAVQDPGARLAGMAPVSASIGSLGSDLNTAGWDSSALLGIRAMDKMVYANIDEIDLQNPEDGLLRTLASAAQSRQRILLESNVWSSARVEQIGAQLFGSEAVPSVDSAILMAEWTGNKWRVTREIGDVANRMGRRFGAGDPVVTPKTLGGTYTAGQPLWKFANAAYQVGSAADITGWTRRAQSSDGVFTIWDSNIGSGTCVLGWRGSASAGDWIVNLKNQGNQWTTLKNVTWDVLNIAVVGQGYDDRFNNKASAIGTALRDNACNYIQITGHSLGGAMALFSAYRWSYTSKTEFFPMVEKVYAFNPARVGNSSYKSDFNARVVNRDIRAYCRTNDVVKDLPANGFVSQCTYTGAAAGTITQELLNHDRANWTKCQSLNPLSC